MGPSTAGIRNAILHPTTSGTVYIGTYNRGLFKSPDCGATWTHINTGKNGPAIDSGGVEIVIDPTNPDAMYAWLNYGSAGFWTSTDGGVNWNSNDGASAFQGSFVEAAAIDPTDPSHLVMSPHGSCVSPHPQNCMAETNDRGATWRYFSSPGWAEGAAGILFGRTTWLYPTTFNGIWLTKDGGSTWSAITLGGPLSTVGTYSLPSGSGVMTSTNATSWSTIKNSPSLPHLVGTGTSLIACDQWSARCVTALDSAPTSWSSFATPSELTATSNGVVWLSYDVGHHILYATSVDMPSSTFQGGVWRIVTP